MSPRAWVDWRRPAYNVVSRESIVLLGLTNSSMSWPLALMRVEWILLVVENESSCAFITNVFPSWCLYLSIGACHDNQHTFLHLNVHAPNIISIGGQPLAIFDGSLGSPKVCQIDSNVLEHSTHLGELRILRSHAPIGSDLCFNNH